MAGYLFLANWFIMAIPSVRCLLVSPEQAVAPVAHEWGKGVEMLPGHTCNDPLAVVLCMQQGWKEYIPLTAITNKACATAAAKSEGVWGVL